MSTIKLFKYSYKSMMIIYLFLHILLFNVNLSHGNAWIIWPHTREYMEHPITSSHGPPYIYTANPNIRIGFFDGYLENPQYRANITYKTTTPFPDEYIFCGASISLTTNFVNYSINGISSQILSDPYRLPDDWNALSDLTKYIQSGAEGNGRIMNDVRPPIGNVTKWIFGTSHYPDLYPLRYSLRNGGFVRLTFFEYLEQSIFEMLPFRDDSSYVEWDVRALDIRYMKPAKPMYPKGTVYTNNPQLQWSLDSNFEEGCEHHVRIFYDKELTQLAWQNKYNDGTDRQTALLSYGKDYYWYVTTSGKDLGSRSSEVLSFRTELPSACTYTLKPSNSDTISACAQDIVFLVETDPTCPVSVTSDDPSWITIVAPSGGSMQGPGGVVLNIGQNPTTGMRWGSITVGQTKYRISQAGATTPLCCYKLTIPNGSSGAQLIGDVVNSSSGSTSFNVTTDPSCSWGVEPWQQWAMSSVNGIGPPTGGYGKGPGVVSVTYTENQSANTREGWFVVWGQKFRLRQSGVGNCNYQLSASGNTVSASGGAGTVNVTTDPTCPVSATSDDPSWITVTTPVRTAIKALGTEVAGTVSYAYAENQSGSPRTGSITLGGVKYTLTQEGKPLPASATCNYALSRAGDNVASSSGSINFNVVTDPTCPWSATSDTPEWITIITPTGNGTGPGTVSGTYTENQNSSVRTGAIFVGGVKYTLTQASKSGTGGGGTVDLTTSSGGGGGCAIGGQSINTSILGIIGTYGMLILVLAWLKCKGSRKKRN
jgi:hypothetical protein